FEGMQPMQDTCNASCTWSMGHLQELMLLSSLDLAARAAWRKCEVQEVTCNSARRRDVRRNCASSDRLWNTGRHRERSGFRQPDFPDRRQWYGSYRNDNEHSVLAHGNGRYVWWHTACPCDSVNQRGGAILQFVHAVRHSCKYIQFS